MIVRHGESVLNQEQRINGDPTVPAPLTDRGVLESRLLGVQVANVPLDACVVTRFPRTRATAELALAGREVPLLVEPLLDDVDVGDLEGQTIEQYRAWKREHTRRDAFPGGESLDAGALRYARAYRSLLEGPHERLLLVCHEIPLRYALNAARGSDALDGPLRQLENAVPYLFDEAALARAVERIEALARV
ncbi:MAG: histidine phosphatase family protein [Gaiellaceae bacterium]